MDECTGHSHDHEHADEAGTSLRPQIDFPRVFCLNESQPNAGRAVLKIHEERLTPTPALLSQEDPDEDPELLFHVPFTEAVSIKSVTIRSSNAGADAGGPPTSAPRTVKLFANRGEHMDFETARDLQPDATLTLLPPEHQFDDRFAGGTIDYPLRPAGRFQNVSSVTLYFPDNYAMPEGADGGDDGEDRIQTEITFVGFKGKGSRMKRMAVECVYESRGMKKDHQVPEEYKGQMGL